MIQGSKLKGGNWPPILQMAPTRGPKGPQHFDNGGHFALYLGLEYASLAWSSHTQPNINKVESVQTRAARFVLGNYTYGPESSIRYDIQRKLGWKPLYVRRA